MEKDVLTLTLPGGFKTKTEINGFEIITDYPEELGGKGEYPKPWDVFLAMMTACHGVHVAEYCLKNDIPMENIKLTLDMKQDPNVEEGKYTDFIIKDFLPADFPEEHIEPMLKETASDCWINRHVAEYDVKIQIKVIPENGKEVVHVVE